MGKILVAILILAFAIRFGLWWVHWDWALQHDGPKYLAMTLTGPGSFNWQLQPLYPWLIFMAHKLTGVDPVMLGGLISVFMGTFLIIVVYVVAVNLDGLKTGFLAALLTAIFPFLTIYSAMILTEATYHVFFLAAVENAFCSWKMDRKADHIATGLAFGLAYNIRSEALWFFLVFFALIVLRDRYFAWKLLPFRFCRFAWIAVGFLPFFFLYHLSAYYYSGNFQFVGRIDHSISYLQSTPERFVDFSNSGVYLWHYLLELKAMYLGHLPLLFHPAFFVILGIGAVKTFKYSRSVWVMFGGVVLLMIIGYPLLVARARYLTNALPFLIILLAISLRAIDRPWLTMLVILSLVPQTVRHFLGF